MVLLVMRASAIFLPFGSRKAPSRRAVLPESARCTWRGTARRPTRGRRGSRASPHLADHAHRVDGRVLRHVHHVVVDDAVAVVVDAVADLLVAGEGFVARVVAVVAARAGLAGLLAGERRAVAVFVEVEGQRVERALAGGGSHASSVHGSRSSQTTLGSATHLPTLQAIGAHLSPKPSHSASRVHSGGTKVSTPTSGRGSGISSVVRAPQPMLDEGTRGREQGSRGRFTGNRRCPGRRSDCTRSPSGTRRPSRGCTSTRRRCPRPSPRR